MPETSGSLSFYRQSGVVLESDETKTVAADSINRELQTVSEKAWKGLQIDLWAKLQIIIQSYPEVHDLIKNLKTLVLTDQRVDDYCDGNIETKAGYFIALQAIVLNDYAGRMNRKDLEINLHLFGHYHDELIHVLKETRLSGIIDTLCEGVVSLKEDVADELNPNRQIATEPINDDFARQQDIRN
jgi:hypothetical protein